jgi:hypothetical protein
MGVSQGVVEWLRSADHDAMHLRDEGLHRSPVRTLEIRRIRGT